MLVDIVYGKYGHLARNNAIKCNSTQNNAKQRKTTQNNVKLRKITQNNAKQRKTTQNKIWPLLDRSTKYSNC